MARSGGDALKIQENGGYLSRRERVTDRNWAAIEDFQPQNRKSDASDVSWISDIPPCVVFTPTIEEFEDPLAYISRIAPVASKYGICKIVSPIVPLVPAGRVLTKENPGFKFNTRVQPMRLSDWDSDCNKVTFLMSAQRYTFPEFEKLADKFHYRRLSSGATQPASYVEAEFWREMLAGNSESIQYASDVDGSAFSSNPEDPLGKSKWNLKILSSLPRSILRLLETIIPGVTEPMLYIGMLFSMFAWHVEDHYLYSINYHHCGASKTWYGVPGDAAQRFEDVVKREVYDSKLLAEHGQGAAYDFLIEKTTMFPPNILQKHGVPVYKAVQAPGEFVITFPRSYHAGLSHGFNCGEAVNFAMSDWFPFGAAACRRYSLLKRMPLLPHEELLWKEVDYTETYDCTKEEAPLRLPTKLAFLRLMSFHHKVRWLLKHRGASIYISLSPPWSYSCMLCKHLCYISFLTCKCFPEPTCLNHAEEMRKCHCGDARSVILHRDIQKMDALAERIESSLGKEQGALPVVEDGMCFDAVSLEEDLLSGEDYSSYVKFEPIEATELAYNEVASSSITVEVEKHEEPPVNKLKPGVAIRTMPSKKKPVHYVLKESVKTGATVSTSSEPSQVRNETSKVKVLQASSGESVVLIKDIVAVLKIQGSLEEISEKWQLEAKNMGLNLRYIPFKQQDGIHVSLSYKACERLKRILPAAQADVLEKSVIRRLRGNRLDDGKQKLVAKQPNRNLTVSGKQTVNKNLTANGKRTLTELNDQGDQKRQCSRDQTSSTELSSSSGRNFVVTNRQVEKNKLTEKVTGPYKLLVKNGTRITTITRDDIPRYSS